MPDIIKLLRFKSLLRLSEKHYKKRAQIVAYHRFPMAVRQISGAIARRIVCPVAPGRKLAKGEIYGMIKFGSRTELYLPCDRFDINVKIGDKVKGGSTIIATLKD